MVRLRKMPICKFCGSECEPNRDPQDGWRCNACGHWQSEHFCNACGTWTTTERVERWRQVQQAAEPR